MEGGEVLAKLKFINFKKFLNVSITDIKTDSQ